MSIGREGGVSLADRAAWRSAARLAPAWLLLALIVQAIVIDRFPNSGDEYAYLWQATAFARGTVAAPSPEPAAAFALSHIGDVGGRRFSKYPPGWPLLLSAGVAAGVPWLVNPLLAALALAGIFRLGCTWIGPRPAMFGAAFVGVSPFFLLNAGSYHSHPSCLFALTALALALAWAVERPARWPLLAAGAAFGLAVLVRPFTALLVGGPLVAGLAPDILKARSGGGARRGALLGSVGWFALGGLPFALALAAVDRAVTGSAFQLAWTYFDQTERLGFGVYGHTLWHGIKTAGRMAVEGSLYTAGVGPLLLLAGAARAGRREATLWAAIALPIVGYIFWWSDGGNRYGPRFYFETLLPATLLMGAGLDRLLARRRDFAWAAGGAALAAILFAGVAVSHHRSIVEREAVYQAVRRAGIRHGLVLLTTASGDMVRRDLTRNPPDFRSADVLFALARGPLDAEVLAAYPDRRAYYYRWSPDGGELWPAR